jgi:hypothetical protein
MFFLVDDHGQRLGKYRSRDEAIDALDRLASEDMLAAHECAVIELDATGERVGEAITHDHVAA